jgi:hypothetical protein
VRWPFKLPFRGTPESGPDVPASARDDAAAGRDDAVAGREHAAVGPAEGAEAAWADLPPIGRTVEPAPLTADSSDFASGLAGSHTPDPILRPLGHDVTADGPGGLVSGLASPILDTRPRTTGGADLPAAAPGSTRVRRAGGRPTAASDGAADEPASAGAGTGSGRLGGAAATPVPLAPVAAGAREARRRLTTVQPETLAAALGAADPGRPGMPGAIAAEGGEAPGSAAGTSAGRTTTGVASGFVAAPASGRASAPSPVPPNGPVIARDPSGAGTGRPGGAGFTEAEPDRAGRDLAGLRGRSPAPGVVIRRSGLGAPLAGPAPVAARPPGLPPRPAVASAPSERGTRAMEPGTGRPPATGGMELPLATLHARAAANEGTGSTATYGPIEPVRQPRGEPGPAAQPGWPPGAARDPGGRTAVRPLLADDPIVPSRLTGPVGAAMASAAEPRPPHVPPTASAAAEEHPPGASVRRSAGPLGGPATEPGGPGLRARTVWAAPLRAGSAAQEGAPSLARSPGTASGSPLPAARADALPGAPAPTRPAAPVDRDPPGSLAGHGGSHAGPGPVRAAASASAPGHAAPPAPASASSGIAVQRAVQADDASGQAAAGAGESAGAGAAASYAGGGGIAGASEGDLDLLARRLYERLRGRLATELLLDRERSGRLADL